MEGGHDVPIRKIISRYQKSILNAYRALSLVDRFYLYDNSVDDHSPELIARFSHGEMVKRYAVSQPEWAEVFLEE